jgi:hypothetical protein
MIYSLRRSLEFFLAGSLRRSLEFFLAFGFDEPENRSLRRFLEVVGERFSYISFIDIMPYISSQRYIIL